MQWSFLGSISRLRITEGGLQLLSGFGIRDKDGGRLCIANFWLQRSWVRVEKFVGRVRRNWVIGADQGWQWGGAGPKDGIFVPAPHGFVLSHPAPLRMTGKTFSPHPHPLGPRKAPPHPIKLYFLLICLTISIIFLMKPISLIKIYLKLQLNLSHQIN